MFVCGVHLNQKICYLSRDPIFLRHCYRVFSVVKFLKRFLDRRASSDYSSSRRHDRDRDRDRDRVRDRDSRGRDWSRNRRHDRDRDRNRDRDHDRDRHEEKPTSPSGEKKMFVKGRNLHLMVFVMQVDIALQ